MTLEERIQNVLDNYPDPMTQAQFADAIGIGKSSAYKLIRDGILPYKDVQEGLLHFHMIHKDDVISYLRNKYAHASEAYVDAGKRCISILLWDEPEILTMKDVIRISGLWKSATQKWIHSGKLQAYHYMHSTIVRKCDLISFMASSSYQDSSHRNIRAQAITMSVEWYKRISDKYTKGGEQ